MSGAVWGVRRTALCLVATVAIAGSAWGWQWPVPDPAVTRSFAQDAGGYLLRGIELGGGAQPVFPVEAGVVVAAHANEPGLASALGAFVVVEHEQAFRSVYAHLDAEMLPRVGQVVTVETPIGTVGESGLVDARVLRLSIIDLESGAFVNPMLLLPDLPDRTPPRVGAVYAREADSLYDLTRRRSIPPGTYELTAAITDRMGARAGVDVAPYGVRVFAGGQAVLAFTADRLVVEPGRTVVEPGGFSARELYATGGLLRLGEVTIPPGQTPLEIVVVDFAGNESIWDVDLTGVTGEDVQ